MMTLFKTTARLSIALAAAGLLSACTAVQGRYVMGPGGLQANGFGGSNYGYNDFRYDTLVAGHSVDARLVGPYGYRGHQALDPRVANGSPIVGAQAQAVVVPRALSLPRPVPVVPAIKPVTPVASASRSVNAPVVLPVPSGMIAAPAAAARIAPALPSAAPLVRHTAIVPTGVAEHAVCHALANPSADPIGLPLSSIGYTAKSFLTLPSVQQLHYRRTTADPAQQSFLDAAMAVDAAQPTYNRSVVPSMIYAGAATRAVRLGNTQFLVDLAPVPGMPGGMHICNLNGELEIEPVKDCCGGWEPALINRGAVSQSAPGRLPAAYWAK